MITSPLQNAGIFLIKILFNTYITIVLLRFIFQLVRADFYNPLSQFIVKVTNPILIPMRKIIPGIGGIDLSSVILLLLLQFLEITSLVLMHGKILALTSMLPIGLFLWGFGEIISLTINVFSFAIFITIILSWLGQHANNPILSLVTQITEPLLYPARRWIPPIAGLDLSPMIVLIILQLLNILIASPLMQLGMQIVL